MAKDKKLSGSVSRAVKGVIDERKDGPTLQQQDKTAGIDDVYVSLGDLSTTNLKDIQTGGKNYEAITMDYIATFNGAVTQGVNPVKALLAMIQACAITMGQCIRAGMREPVALGMVAFIVNTAKKAKSEVKIITKPH